ncbi:MAG: hypothetical protein CMH63_03670 [Nanoarchaeota archaeon]|jgi:hypothetical protein|nr:hypothetical protein [Nanoarchaeota archaeon]|tara:strand:+ start:811 stop:1806 length:996 start_codon:yes stop_codon:yes gene_type:complete
MIVNLNYDEILSKLKEKGLSEEEIEKKIKEKTDQLSGLVSKEGAAHIIANELGVKIFEDVGEIKIGEVKNGMRNVNLNGKVTMNFGIREFKKENREGRVGNFLIGDETGTIRVVLWDDGHLNVMEKEIKEDVVVRVENGYIRENNGYKEIHLNKDSVFKLNPEGIVIEKVISTPVVTKEKQIKDLKEEDKNVSLKGTVVQIFDPRFFEVCGECGKRANMENGIFKCAAHGQVEPSFSSVVNCILDDGSENIRLVCFRDQVSDLFGINPEELLKLKDTPGDVEPLKDKILGKQIKVGGRAVKNDMFNRIEFIANNLEELNPEMLLKELESDI